jgi:hypothetical protein
MKNDEQVGQGNEKQGNEQQDLIAIIRDQFTAIERLASETTRALAEVASAAIRASQPAPKEEKSSVFDYSAFFHQFATLVPFFLKQWSLKTGDEQHDDENTESAGA